jgi:redox-sensitive bicupin YhaK (pirin superfamily)
MSYARLTLSAAMKGTTGFASSDRQRGKSSWRRRLAMGDVGTSKIFENDRIIIWELLLEPGKQIACHTHRYDYVFYVLEGSRIEALDENDNPLLAFNANTGDVFALGCEDGELISTDGKGLRVPAMHSARNIGASRYREILVETKK